MPNEFKRTGIEKLDFYIDHRIDLVKTAKSKADSNHYIGELQGVRMTLAILHGDDHQQTISDIAMQLIESDKFQDEFDYEDHRKDY